MIIYVDIDETICHTINGDYPNSKPIQENIDKINSLYALGHEIIYWTARGSVTGLDWRELTKQQLKDWGCKHHRLEKLKKPHYHIFIDDKAISAKINWENNDVVDKVYSLQ